MLYPVSETLNATETIHILWSTWPKELLAVLSTSMVLSLVTISLTKISPKKTSWSAQLNFIFSFAHFPSHSKVILQICCNGKVTPIHQARYAPSPKLVCISIPPARDNRLRNKATLSWKLPYWLTCQFNQHAVLDFVLPNWWNCVWIMWKLLCGLSFMKYSVQPVSWTNRHARHQPC